MKNLWNEAEAAGIEGALGLCVYTSRLLGREPSLVLYGGGNTSVKIDDLLYVKGTGSDLAQVDESDFTPLHLDCVRRLPGDEAAAPAEMMRLLDGCIARRPAPRPSIETMLHAALPFTYVEHAHAYSVLAATNVEHIERVTAELYGELAPLVPYRHSGSELARQCAAVFRDRGTTKTIGLVLAFHGVVAFGTTARESYENMIRINTLAEDYLRAKGAWDLAAAAMPAPAPDRTALAKLRAHASRAAGFPLIMRTLNDPFCMAFARRADLPSVSQQGPATPQHAMYTKRVPQLGRDVDAFAQRYREYLARHLGTAADGRIDPAPRIILDPELGVCALGVNAEYATRAAEVYRRDIEVISRASAHDHYRAAPEREIARAELDYGGFEIALRARVARDQPLLGQVALVTAGAAQCDPALATRLAAQGAVVVMGGASDPGIVLDEIAITFGGLDLAYVAGSENTWRNAIAKLLDHSPVGGHIVTVEAGPMPEMRGPV